MANRGEFADAFIKRMGFPQTEDNMVAMLSWMRSEFGNDQGAQFNPMATTYQLEPMGDNWNSVGVRQYEDFTTGVEANALTLSEDHPGYSQIRDAFFANAGPFAICQAISASAWGSHPSGAIVTTVRSQYDRDAAISVGPGEISSEAPASPPVPTQDWPVWPGVELRMFHTGDGTATWQQRMSDRGWTIAVDDIFGPQTDRVCRQFQAEKGLVVDGIVGPITWNAAWTEPIT